jgi:hypothetical protein
MEEPERHRKLLDAITDVTVYRDVYPGKSCRLGLLEDLGHSACDRAHRVAQSQLLGRTH